MTALLVTEFKDVTKVVRGIELVTLFCNSMNYGILDLQTLFI